MSYDSNWFMGSRILFQECIDNKTPWDFYVMDVILHRIRYNGNKGNLGLGECYIGLRELGELVGKDHKSVSRSLKRLEMMRLIRASYEPHKGTKITVLLHSMFSNTGHTRAPVKDQPRELNIHNNTIHKEHIYPESSNKKPKSRDIPTSPETSEVIAHLNSESGKRFPTSKNSVSLVAARLKEGHTVEDMKLVISFKVKEWVDDPKMKKYITPDTLLGPKNFQKYVDIAKAQIPMEEKYAELFPSLGGA